MGTRGAEFGAGAGAEPAKKQRLKGYYFYGVTHADGERDPDNSGTLCPTCYKRSVKGWTAPGNQVIPGVSFHRTEEIRGGDDYDVDVCNDCGKTIRKGKYL